MCSFNSISQNKLNIKEGEKKLDYSIESEISYDQPIMARSILAKTIAYRREDKIEYVKRHPLNLGNKSRIHSITAVLVDDKHKEFCIKYWDSLFKKKGVTSILRFKEDKVDDVEKFLLHARTIYELHNIDLKYMHK